MSRMPTALGLVFDTSLSMEYKEKDKTRLDEAKERAREIAAQAARLEPGLRGRLGRAGPVPIGLSPAAALKRIDALDDPAGQPAAQCRHGPGLRRGRRVRPAGARRLRLTDLCRTAWHPERPAEGLDKVAQAQDEQGLARSPRSSWAGPQGDRQRRGRFGRAVLERRDPGRADRDPRPDPVAGPEAGDPHGRVRARRQEEGREDASRSRPTARSRSASPPPRARRGRAAPGQDQAERRARPVRRRRRAVTSRSGSGRR